MPDAPDPLLAARIDALGKRVVINPWWPVIGSLAGLALAVWVWIAGHDDENGEFLIVLVAATVAIVVASLALAVPRFSEWNLARRVAREHVAEHGGEFPLAFRWTR